MTAFSIASAPVVIKQRLVRAAARREPVQPFAERDIGFVARDLETGVGDALELGAHGLDARADGDDRC